MVAGGIAKTLTWFIRLFQLFFAIILVGVLSYMIHQFRDVGVRSPREITVPEVFVRVISLQGLELVIRLLILLTVCPCYLCLVLLHSGGLFPWLHPTARGRVPRLCDLCWIPCVCWLVETQLPRPERKESSSELVDLSSRSRREPKPPTPLQRTCKAFGCPCYYSAVSSILGALWSRRLITNTWMQLPVLHHNYSFDLRCPEVWRQACISREACSRRPAGGLVCWGETLDIRRILRASINTPTIVNDVLEIAFS